MKRERPAKSGALFASLRGHKKNRAERFRPIYHLIHLTKAKGCVILASKLRRAVRRADKMKRKAGMDMKRRSWKRWLSALFAGVLLLSLLSGCSVEWGDIDDVTGEVDMTHGTAEEYEQEVIRLVNKEREAYGLPALSANDAIMAAAHARLKELDINRSHTRPDGTPYYTILPDYGISPYAPGGENLAYGYKTPRDVVGGWMNSPGHRANILKEGITIIGVAYNPTKHYWVQIFSH